MIDVRVYLHSEQKYGRRNTMVHTCLKSTFRRSFLSSMVSTSSSVDSLRREIAFSSPIAIVKESRRRQEHRKLEIYIRYLSTRVV